MIIAAAVTVWMAGCTAGAGSPVNQARMVWMTDAWSRAIRPALAGQLALRWDGAHWSLDAGAAEVKVENIAASAYFAQPLLDAGINLALSDCDRVRLDEIADYYLTAFGRFATFGDLIRARGPLRDKLRAGDFTGDSATRTLRWLRAASKTMPARSAECLLCVSQFLHPAARLIRLFATLPLGDLNSVERRFITSYEQLIVQDQVLRFAYEAPLELGLSGGASHGAVDGWRALALLPRAKRTLYPSGLRDTDLWLLSEAAELLAAHGSAPSLVLLSASDSARLFDFLDIGVKLLQGSATRRTVAHDSAGNPIEGLDFFEGEFSRYADDAFAGDSSPTFPTAPTARVDSIGWDISHATRIPVVLRSLWDARRRTGESFPSDTDLSQAAHQLSYRAFDGDMARPLFFNFMDGTDGWYRVGYAGRGQWGYPPSRYCDGRDVSRQCLGTAVLGRWGVLVAFDPHLQQLADRLIELASTRDSATIAFRDRYYFQDGPFSFDVSPGVRPSVPLFELLAGFAQPALEWAHSQ
ncbi:MAG: hypothetical protein WBC97_00365 [Gemmatimonadales bacterium]